MDKPNKKLYSATPVSKSRANVIKPFEALGKIITRIETKLKLGIKTRKTIGLERKEIVMGRDTIKRNTIPTCKNK